ncbi:DUF4919 domain-containing protein [Burkholderia sp. 22PA0099]|uniref:hypothetical protein n=1 Tax=Burkholderia sp. 22PA0099 TaxID=3237372 RepID=UPI0039C13C7B
MQTARQALADNAQINFQQFSRDTLSIVTAANALDRSGKDWDALTKLQELEKYAPLAQYPDYDAQIVCFNIYHKLGLIIKATECRQRVDALADILLKRSGSGDTPDDPVRVVRIGEMGVWVRLHSGTVGNVSTLEYRGATLQKVSYVAPAGGSPGIVYFTTNPREAQEIKQANPDIFKPLPVTADQGKFAAALKDAHERRITFLNDTSFNYLELIRAVQDDQKQAMQLIQQGDATAALAKLREIEKIRPLRDIPIFSLMSVYSFLLGKSGDTQAQDEIRLYLFGIEQDIAHSGDGLTPDTAVHVVAISEEVNWLLAKKLRAGRQSLDTVPARKIDAIDTVDAGGQSRTYYFDVTELYKRYRLVAAAH